MTSHRHSGTGCSKDRAQRRDRTGFHSDSPESKIQPVLADFFAREADRRMDLTFTRLLHRRRNERRHLCRRTMARGSEYTRFAARISGRKLCQRKL